MFDGQKGTKMVSTASESAGGPSRSEVVDELLLSQAELPRMSELSATPQRSHSLRDQQLSFHLSREEHEQQLASLRARIASELRERGIEKTDEVGFSINPDGTVHVSGGHPRTPEIEQLFKDKPELRNEVSRMSAEGSLLAAMEESIRFQEAYRKDPLQAIAEFSYLFERTRTPTITIPLVPPESND